MKIKISLFKLSILLVLTFFSGYFLRSIHYRQDSQRTEQIQAENRTGIHEIKRDFVPVIESAIKAFEAHPVTASVEPRGE